MKTKEELLHKLLSKLDELEDGRVKVDNPALAHRLGIELALLDYILGDDVPNEYWDRIVKESV